MKKKIGLLSVYNHNFGSILQAYALQKTLDDWGYSTEIILYKKTNYVKQALRLLYFPLLKTTLKSRWKSIYCKIFQKDVYEKILLTREEAFRQFIKDRMHFSSVCKGRKQLIESCHKYDCFVLGSDQVWNPMNLGGDFYTMTFIPEDMKKITYAPSFGVSNIPIAQREKTKTYLKRIQYISVRESDGQKIVKDLIGRDVPMVVDPTILAGRNLWDKISDEQFVGEKYIFCYFISKNPNYRAFAKRLAKKTGYRIVTIPHVDEYVKADMNFGDVLPQGVGPEEFVKLIRYSEYVCTDSFHGIVFSTMYKRTFFAFSRYSNEGIESTNSRIYSFLEMIGLTDRLYKGNEDICDESLRSIDFTNAVDNIDALKKESIHYLKMALSS